MTSQEGAVRSKMISTLGLRSSLHFLLLLNQMFEKTEQKKLLFREKSTFILTYQIDIVGLDRRP